MARNVLNLDIGCGNRKKPGFIGVDIRPTVGVDIVADICNLPIKDNSCDYARSYHLLEHLDDPIRAIEELYRILKPNSIWKIQVPHFSSLAQSAEITHKRAFCSLSFKPFCQNQRQEGSTKYSDANFILEKVKLNYHCLNRLGKEYKFYKYLGFIFVKLLDWIANINIILTERTWVYWVGGFDHITFWLRKI